MKNLALILTAIIFLSLPLYAIQPANAQQTSDADEHISVHEYSGGFRTYMNIGSFNASSGNYVGVDLSTSSTTRTYNEIEVQIVGATTGLAYDVRATRFAETFQLNNDDTYNITIIKHTPFYDDLTVSGEITIYHRLVALRTNPPSPSPIPTLKPTLSPTATPSPSPLPTPSITLTPSPTVPEFSWLAILPLFASLLFCVVLVSFRNKINKNTK
jgi:hypothetical protein